MDKVDCVVVGAGVVGLAVARALASKFAGLDARFVPPSHYAKGSYFTLPGPARGDASYAQVRKYWPGLPDEASIPGYAGIRPKIAPAHEAARDFWIQGPTGHGVPGLVNLFGIESPGLTSSLAIGEYVACSLSK